jgi:hypothetical protein
MTVDVEEIREIKDKFDVADNLTQCQNCKEIGISCDICGTPIDNLATTYCLDKHNKEPSIHICFDCWTYDVEGSEQ